MSMFKLYLFIKLDYFIKFFDFISTMLIICFFIYLMFKLFQIMNDLADDELDQNIFFKNIRNKAFKIFTPLILITIFIQYSIPTTKEMAFIYIVGKMSQNKTIENIAEKSLNIPDKALEVLQIKMDEYLKEIRIKK